MSRFVILSAAEGDRAAPSDVLAVPGNALRGVLKSVPEAAMDDRELERQLRAEGFRRAYVWQDAPRVHYPAHTHPGLTAHIILDGEMTLTVGGQSRTYGPGERCDVPAGAVHSAHMGPVGCRYLIGEK